MKAQFLSMVLLAFCVSMFVAPEATANAKAGKTDNQMLSLERVEVELQARIQREKLTTLQRQRANEDADRDFVGKSFQDVIEVKDVAKHAGGELLIESVARGGGLLWFFIKDSRLNDKAAGLNVKDKVIMKARLLKIYYQPSGYVNRSGWWIAQFDVESFDVKSDTKAK